MQIQPYDSSHLEAVVRLSLRAWAPVFESLAKALEPYVYEAFYPEGWRVSQDKAVRDVCASADMKVWVAIESGTVAGFFAVRYHAADKLGEIYMIAVDPDFQRRGIALAMTDFAVERMKEAGMAVAMVDTGGDPGHGPARAAHEKAGFRVLPVARYFRKLQESTAMNMRWHGALCAVVLTIAAGGSRSEEIIVCKADNPKDCKPAAEWEREEAAEFAKQRQYAEALPFDYRDLLRALLVEYIRSTSLPGADHRYFVAVFGSDIDAALTAKLHASGIDVLPISAWKSTDDPPEPDRSGSRVKIHVGEIKQVAPDTFSIRIGYYCGPRCAASEAYTLQKGGDGWRIVDRKLDFIA